MKKKLILTLLLGFIVLSSGYFYYKKASSKNYSLNSLPPAMLDEKAENPISKAITVYKSASCGCCAVYASYLKREGFSVNIENTEDLSTVKEEYGVPRELSSCHTSIIDGYVVEGHIPTEAIEKLLTEKPKIKGIAMPGMPIGSPGMPGVKEAPFEIYKLGEEGLFMSI